MLTHLHIDGFRSIESLDLDMGSLTVLIGPNGSGKSNILDLFSFLSAAAGGSLADGIASRGGLDVLRFRGSTDGSIRFHLDFDSDRTFRQEADGVHYRLDLRQRLNSAFVWFEEVSIGPRPGMSNPMTVAKSHLEHCAFRNVQTRMTDAVDESKGLESDSELAIYQVRDGTVYPTPHKLAGELVSWRVYPPISTVQEAPIRHPQVLRSGLRLAPDGRNLASVLHGIQNHASGVWEQVVDVLQTTSPGFGRLTFSSEGADGTITLRWWEEPYSKEYGFPVNVLSDGTLRLLMLVAILVSPDPPPLICIDEPELGLHPDWVKVIGELLQSAATRTQLVVATHSPELVSKVQPSQVVVVEKENGRTIANRLSDDDFAHWLDEFRLGDLWRAGHIGGRA
jgi:predicted ATPase